MKSRPVVLVDYNNRPSYLPFYLLLLVLVFGFMCFISCLVINFANLNCCIPSSLCLVVCYLRRLSNRAFDPLCLIYFLEALCLIYIFLMQQRFHVLSGSPTPFIFCAFSIHFFTLLQLPFSCLIIVTHIVKLCCISTSTTGAARSRMITSVCILLIFIYNLFTRISSIIAF